MTPAEIIATKLLDFDALQHLNDAHENCYLHRPSSNVASVNPKTGHLTVSWEGCEEWPDLADWNDIRRMEDALAKKGLGAQYACALVASLRDAVLACLGDQDIEASAFHLVSVPCLRATAEQRVAAALKVISE
jgi:hypothetical protein